MTASRDKIEMAAEGETGRREWVRPAVQQLAAGSAEDGSGPATDASTNPS
jgi:hypothetical protein